MTLGALVVGVAAVTFADRPELVAPAGEDRPRPRAWRAPSASRRWDRRDRRQGGAGRRSPGTSAARSRTAAITPRSPVTSTRPIGRDRPASTWRFPAGRSPVRRLRRRRELDRLRADRGPLVRRPGRGRRPDHRLHAGPGLHVGDTVTLRAGGRSITVTARRRDLRHAARERRPPRPARRLGRPRDPRSRPSSRRAGRCSPAPGTDVQDYRSAPGRDRRTAPRSSSRATRPVDASFLLFLSVIAFWASCSSVMSLGGVFNTVLLETRQRTREMAVLKALGLTPAQVVAMVVAIGRAGRAWSPASSASRSASSSSGGARLHGRGGGEDAHPRRRCTTCSRSWCWSVSACWASRSAPSARTCRPSGRPREHRAGAPGGVTRPEQRPSGIEIA